jgi:PadR family transcriptional regulator, regulatory protein AphA
MMSLDHYMMCAISTMPSTGYDIKMEFEHPGAGQFWGISFGSIYPRLKKLEENGYITTLFEESSGRGKKVYELTIKGWRELQTWLKKKPSSPIMKDELLVKVSFWATILQEDREGLINHLLERKQHSEETLAYYQAWPTNGISTIGEHGMFVIEYVTKKLQAELEWIDETIEKLKGPAQPPAQDPNNLIAKSKQRYQQALEVEKKKGGNG